jgi:hypothetical protein
MRIASASNPALLTITSFKDIETSAVSIFIVETDYLIRQAYYEFLDYSSNLRRLRPTLYPWHLTTYVHGDVLLIRRRSSRHTYS